MVLYLPVGIYAGHFKGAGVISILKMIFLDGTSFLCERIAQEKKDWCVEQSVPGVFEEVK